MERPTSTAEELQTLAASIGNLAKAYDPKAPTDAVDDQRAALRDNALKLLAAASTPEDMIWQILTSSMEGVAIRCALRLGIYGAIPPDEAISRADLAKKVHATETLIERIMRYLVGTGMFDQTGPDGSDYRHTEVSRSMVDQSKPGTASIFLTWHDLYLKPMITFDEFLVKTAKDGMFVEPASNVENPLVHYYGKPGQNVFDVMYHNPEVMKTFTFMMVGFDSAVPPTGPWYDYSKFKAIGPDDDRIQLVDVGGGDGKVIHRILAATPELDPTKCVLQDVEVMIKLTEPIQQLGVKVQTIDFHKEQPIKGAKAYFLRFITHDYHDKDATNILSHISQAMASDSVLIIADSIIPEEINYFTQKAGMLDQCMFVIGGKERTERGFVEILSKAGLELASVNRIPKSAGAVLECRKMSK